MTEPTPSSSSGQRYPQLSPTAQAALSGLLAHLPALLPFISPSVNSYDRLQPCCWSGAFLCWGWDNKEVREAGGQLLLQRQLAGSWCHGQSG
jgi:glutamine synthetase